MSFIKVPLDEHIWACIIFHYFLHTTINPHWESIKDITKMKNQDETHIQTVYTYENNAFQQRREHPKVPKV